MTFTVRSCQAWFLGILCLSAAPVAAADGPPSPVFTRDEVARYQPKGPSRCFRQICLEYNTTGRYDYRRGRLGKPEEMIKDFSQADAARYAEFCRSINLDGVLLLAVPEGGYATYLQTRVGEPFPYLKQHQFDFFGQTLKECHRRGISVFGYIIIGWCKRAQAEFPADFPEKGDAAIPSLNGRYAERIIEYAREILTSYPVDGLRTDILDHNTRAYGRRSGVLPRAVWRGAAREVSRLAARAGLPAEEASRGSCAGSTRLARRSSRKWRSGTTGSTTKTW